MTKLHHNEIQVSSIVLQILHRHFALYCIQYPAFTFRLEILITQCKTENKNEKNDFVHRYLREEGSIAWGRQEHGQSYKGHDISFIIPVHTSRNFFRLGLAFLEGEMAELSLKKLW